jgi:predicted nuclease with TOPRIM domain
MPEDQMPLWARQFQSEMLRGLSDLRDTIKDAVSRDTFRDEKDRVNGEFIKVYEELKSARDENSPQQIRWVKKPSSVSVFRHRQTGSGF